MLLSFSIFLLPAIPFAIRRTESLVDVSPSTEIMLKVSSTIERSIVCKSFSSTAASEVIKHSIVAIFGCIIPEPLHIPPICTGTPSTSNSTAACFDLVSVVIIASAASAASAAAAPSCPGSCFIPFPIISIGSCFPITPVLATSTASSLIPSSAAVCAAIRRHFS